MIHLAGVGGRYVKGREGIRTCVEIIKTPRRTLCGLPLTGVDISKRRVAMPWDDPRSCRACLKAVLTRETEHAIPIYMEMVA